MFVVNTAVGYRRQLSAQHGRLEKTGVDIPYKYETQTEISSVKATPVTGADAVACFATAEGVAETQQMEDKPS